MNDRITPGALRLAHNRIVAPVILESRPGGFQELLHEITPFTQVNGGHRPILPIIQRLSYDVPHIMRPLKRFDMIAALLPREVIFAFGDNKNVRRIYPDKEMYALQYPIVPLEGVFHARHKLISEITFTSTMWTKQVIGANTANNKGYSGENVLVSVIDSGAARTHEQIRRTEFKTTIPAQHRDENGHGTWCTTCIGGVVAADEYLSRQSGHPVTCEGMAPKCDLLAIKALGYYIGMGSTSDILQAVDLSIVNEADIISMSLGGAAPEESPDEDAHYPVMNRLAKLDIIPIVAAGNAGPNEKTLGSPGHLPSVLTVGAFDPISGEIAEFSSRGPTNWGDVKPDVTSPGVNINSGSVGVCDMAGDGVISRYSPLSGTSMATPHVAGLVALMRQSMQTHLQQKLTLAEIKRLMAELGQSKNNIHGWGILTWDMWEHWMSSQYGVTL